jgi:hypothetical protein
LNFVVAQLLKKLTFLYNPRLHKCVLLFEPVEFSPHPHSLRSSSYVLSSVIRCPYMSLPLRVWAYFVWISHLPHACYMPHSSHLWLSVPVCLFLWGFGHILYEFLISHMHAICPTPPIQSFLL